MAADGAARIVLHGRHDGIELAQQGQRRADGTQRVAQFVRESGQEFILAAVHVAQRALDPSGAAAP